MNTPIPFRSAARAAGGGSVVPLHRRPQRVRPPADPSRDILLQLEPAQVVQRAYYLEARKGFATDSALAGAIGVNRSQVTRWAQGRAAHAANAWLLRDVAAAVSRMAEFYNTATISRWLFCANPDLGGEQPIALLRQGRLPEVLMAVQARTSGSFG